MRVLITGAGGFIGQTLIAALAENPLLPHPEKGLVTLREVICFDVMNLVPASDLPFALQARTGNLMTDEVLPAIIQSGVDIIFHLASVVSAAAERDFDLGMSVNMDGTRRLLDACRKAAYPPRVIMTSSIAVFGAAVPGVVSDNSAAVPLTSYGVQKAIGELLIQDYARKGYIDGCALRLPTVVVRPGKPNAAASSFASSIIREPLRGTPAVCPVSPETELYIASPRTVAAALIHAAAVTGKSWAGNRTLILPGIRVTVAEMVASLVAVAGAASRDLIRWQQDPQIQTIISGWPSRFDTARAAALGFSTDASMDEIIRQFVREHTETHIQ